MSIAHKNTGDLVTATDYNAIADNINSNTDDISTIESDVAGKVPLELTEDTVINTNGHSVTINTASGAKTNQIVVNNNGLTATLTDDGIGDFGGSTQVVASAGSLRTSSNLNGDPGNNNAGAQATLFDITNNDIYGQYIDENQNIALYQVDATGVWFQNQMQDKWAYYDKQYHSDGSEPLPHEIPDWQFIEGYVDGMFNAGIATLTNGQVTVNSELVKTISRQITLNYETINGTLGILAALGADITDGTSFIIKSLNSDGSINTADNSDVRWCVIGD